MTTEEIMGISFSTSEKAVEQTEELRRNLGLPTKAQVARMAIGLSLGLSDGECLPSSPDKKDKTIIKGATLFGDGAGRHLWQALLVADGSRRTEKFSAQELVARHWQRGVALLVQDWRDAEQEDEAAAEKSGVYGRFVGKLMRRADLPETADKPNGDDPPSLPDGKQLVAKAVRLHLGKEVDSEEDFVWTVNGVGYAPHIAIMGESGSGKTRVLLEMLRQFKEQAIVPVLLLDLGKGELADQPELARELGANVLKVPDVTIPLDMFNGSNVSPEAAGDVVLGFQDSITKVNPRIGDKQKDNFRRALIPFFQRNEHITLEKIRDCLDRYYQENDLRPDSLSGLLNELTLRLLFTSEMAPADFFSRSWIITFAQARESTRNLAVYLLLDALNTYMKRLSEALRDAQGHRAIRMILAVDEARDLLGSRHKALSDNIRLHRSKGLVVALASQSPDDYDGAGDDYLENIGLPVCLKTNASATEIIKNMFKGKASFAGLEPGVCMTIKENRPIRVQVY